MGGIGTRRPRLGPPVVALSCLGQGVRIVTAASAPHGAAALGLRQRADAQAIPG